MFARNQRADFPPPETMISNFGRIFTANCLRKINLAARKLYKKKSRPVRPHDKTQNFTVRESFETKNVSRKSFSDGNLSGGIAPANPIILGQPTLIVNNLLIINFRRAAEREKSALSANCIISWQQKPSNSEELEILT